MKRKYLAVTLVLWALCMGLMGCGGERVVAPLIEKGTLDLRGVNLQDTGPLDLAGPWSFYWDTLATPQQLATMGTTAYLNVPLPYNSIEINGSPLPREGKGTYALTILLDSTQLGQPLSLKTRTIYLAYRIFLNGTQVLAGGAPEASQFKPGILTELHTFTPSSPRLQLVVQTASYNFFKGGQVQPLQLGPAAVVQRRHLQNLALNVFLTGCLAMVGLYHLILFGLFRANRSALYFGLLCLMLAGRVAVTDEHFLASALPQLSHWLALRIEYGSLYMGPWVLVGFFHQLYPKEVPNWMLWMHRVLGVGLGLTLLVPNAMVFSMALPVGQLGMLASGITVVVVTLPRAMARKRPASSLFFVAFVILFITAVNDMLYVSHRLNTMPLSAYGMLGFAFTQALALATRFGLTFRQLLRLQKNLEAKVEARTQEITEKNTMLEQQKEELITQTEQMLANLEYARRIQQATLDSETVLDDFFNDSFILYLPRDYVSGDFYWLSEVEGLRVVVAADCTGHGVPGAFMTAMGQALLDQIIIGQKETNPEKILHRFEDQLKTTLQTQVDGKDIPDGMDMGIIVMDAKEPVLHFAGAKFDLVRIHQGKLERIRGAKFPVGQGTHYKQKTFPAQQVPYETGDRFYLFSDGYADQFGGPEGTKYYTKKFRQLLEDTAQGSMKEQLQQMEVTFHRWKGQNPQTDDVLVVGMEL